MIDVIQPIGAATEKLKALQNSMPASARNASQDWLLTLAMAFTDRTAVKATMFTGYVIIYNKLINDADRQSVDAVIGTMSETALGSAKRYADYLTLLATGAPLYGEEIRQARNAVRAWQA